MEEGLFMVQEAGAKSEDYVKLRKESLHFDFHVWPLNSAERDPLMQWVNNQGERSTDETITMRPFEAFKAILRQPE
jgi:hypothetical protein